MITPERLDEMQERCDAATAGPWEVKDNPVDENWADLYPNDSKFIAHARTDLPDCIEEIQLLNQEVRRLQNILMMFGDKLTPEQIKSVKP